MSLSSISQVLGGQDSDAVLIRAMTAESKELAVKASRSERVSGLLVWALLARRIPTGILAPLHTNPGGRAAS